MQLPPEIVFKGVKTTPYVDKLIDRGLAGLEQVCDYMTSTRIAVERAQGRHQTGNPYTMRIDMRIPGRPEIVVKRSSKGLKKAADGLAEVESELALQGQPEPKRVPVVRDLAARGGIREEPLAALIRRTFGAARRELEKVVEKQHGEVKASVRQQTSAVVERIFREEGYGFLRSLGGEQVYFHKNSVLHDHWEDLKVGAAVRYAPELGEKGLQASTVEETEKRGSSEAHDDLHELPVISSRRSRSKKR